jgi:hypothetical protein
MDTHKGRYFASPERDIRNLYLINHNGYIDNINKHLITLWADNRNEEFIGCGGLISLKIDLKKINLILTTGHVIRDLLTTSDKIKIPINYFIFNSKSLINECFSIGINEKNCSINTKNDYSIIGGFSNLIDVNYEFIDLKNSVTKPIKDEKALIFGCLGKKVDKAIRKKNDTYQDDITVYAFQMPTKIITVQRDYFEIIFPKTMYFAINGNMDDIKEGHSPDPSGLSGSIVWSYSNKNGQQNPLGIIIERSECGIKCTRMDIILEDLLKAY